MAELERALETRRLLLEPLVPSHAPELYAHLRDPRLYQFIPQEPPVSLQSVEARYTALFSRLSPDGQEVWLNWVLRRRDTMAYVGIVEATVHADQTATIAYMIFVPFWRQGYAQEACACVLDHLFHDYKVSLVAADVDTRNVASVRLVESLGFERVSVQADADFFKGAPSHEYRYERASTLYAERYKG